MMKRTTIKIVIALIIVALLAGIGVALYFRFNHGPITGRIQYGEIYQLESIRPTERFAGAQMSNASYFRMDKDGKTGKFYLEGLTASAAPVPFIVTNYKEGTKQTTFDIEYLIDNGDKTSLQCLTAVSTNDHNHYKICLRAVESHAVRIIQQNHDNTNSLEYPVDILIFTFDREVA